MKTREFPLYCFLLLLLIWLPGCVENEEDYISKYCPGSCTVVSGRILQGSAQQPQQDIQVTATWKNLRTFKAGGGGTTRKKAVAYSDQDGRYTLRFLLRDDEMEEGYIEINPPQTAVCRTQSCQSYTLYWHELKRDTSYAQDFLIP